jgi:hypothetical protein
MAIIINGRGRVGVRTSSGGGGSTPSYLLDTYGGAAAAYSLRKLSSTYSGNAIRVRRSSDNTETNIGFNADGSLNTTALTAFVGAGNGFVVVWYDQSGNSNNATQLTAALQARIVNAGVITLQNGKPIVDFYGSGIFYTYSNIVATQNISIYLIQKRNDGKSISVSNTAGGPGIEQSTDNNFYIQRVNGNNGFYSLAADSTTTFCLLEGYSNPSGMSAYKNNVAYALSGETSFGSTVTTYNSIANYNGNAASVGYAAEIIIYTNSQIPNRAAINTNINSYYSIY